jgi:hypothetical protein
MPYGTTNNEAEYGGMVLGLYVSVLVLFFGSAMLVLTVLV